MKNIKYIIFASLTLLLGACDNWMNTAPEGSIKTEAQKSDAASKNSEAALGDVNAMYAQMIAEFGGLGELGYERHNDFGMAAVSIMVESNGQDFTGYNSGFNWFSASLYPNNRNNSLTNSDGIDNLMVWNILYKIVNTANNVIGSIDTINPGSQEANLCQAYCVRAFAYMQLAQIFQTTYVGSENKKCVPITLPNMSQERQAANPRATVSDVYKLIMHDLDYACASKAFSEFERKDNSIANQAVAYGLRARADLIMQNYQAAAIDAAAALAISEATPLSIEECQTPGFCDATKHNVIWGNIIVETNAVVLSGIVNWPSHLSSFYQDGYTGVGSYHGLASNVYKQIPTTDVRKGWWLNENLESPLLNVGSYKDAKAALQKDASLAYITTKFGTGDGTIKGNGAAAADWILMRAEEMILIIAEATKDAKFLETFVQTYRDPKYKVSGSIEDAVWFQRRIELWGEGFGFQDIMRLHKPIIRSEATNWPAAWVQDIPADHGCLLWRIPQSEIEANQGISEADNNPYVPFP